MSVADRMRDELEDTICRRCNGRGYMPDFWGKPSGAVTLCAQCNGWGEVARRVEIAERSLDEKEAAT